MKITIQLPVNYDIPQWLAETILTMYKHDLKLAAIRMIRYCGLLGDDMNLSKAKRICDTIGYSLPTL